jgi:energy-coupling factor transport system ATP-binding protein
MLQLTGATYRYAGYARPVLHDVDLRLDDGEIVGLVGANEAGKSTLCLVASGLAPTSIGGELKGTLTLDGTPAAGLKTHELAERVVVAFQNPNTQRSGIAATVFEEIALGPMNLGLAVAETVARTHEAIARLRLEHLVTRDPQRLSGGQAQLVAIASLLAMRPRHIILDEPTAQLDPAGTRLVGEALRSLAETGTSLLIAEHKTDLLDGLCGRIVAIDGGRIVLDGPTVAIFDDPRLAELGVEPPARARLGRALVERGIDSAVVVGALAAAAGAEGPRG